MQILVDLVEEAGGREPALIRADEQREILGHMTRFHRVDDYLFQRFGEAFQLGIVIELCAVLEPAGPRIDRGDGIGRGDRIW